MEGNTPLHPNLHKSSRRPSLDLINLGRPGGSAFSKLAALRRLASVHRSSRTAVKLLQVCRSERNGSGTHMLIRASRLMDLRQVLVEPPVNEAYPRL
eukprot:6209763-Pleurochrysis_carterae.AAC.4